MKIEVIPNRLEKYMTFFLNKNLVFIDSMQFMNFSLEKLVKNLSANDFKYSTQEFRSKTLELFKQKMLIHMNTWTVLKDLVKRKKLPNEKCFYGSLKDGTTGDNGEKLNIYMSDKEYLTRIKIWINLTRRTWMITMTIIWEKMFCY